MHSCADCGAYVSTDVGTNIEPNISSDAGPDSRHMQFMVLHEKWFNLRATHMLRCWHAQGCSKVWYSHT